MNAAATKRAVVVLTVDWSRCCSSSHNNTGKLAHVHTSPYCQAQEVWSEWKLARDNLYNLYMYNTAASPIQVSSPIGCQAKMQSPGWSSLTCVIKKLGKHAQQSSQII